MSSVPNLIWCYDSLRKLVWGTQGKKKTRQQTEGSGMVGWGWGAAPSGRRNTVWPEMQLCFFLLWPLPDRKPFCDLPGRQGQLLDKWYSGKGGRCHCSWGHTVVRITHFCQTGRRREQRVMKFYLLGGTNKAETLLGSLTLIRGPLGFG